MDGVGINTSVIRTGKVVKEHTEHCRGNMIEQEHAKGGLDDDRGILKWAKSLVGGDRSWKSTKIIYGCVSKLAVLEFWAVLTQLIARPGGRAV